MTIELKKIKPATPWNVSLAKLTNLEQTITASEGEALKARWLFGRELVSRRVDYKGRQVIPHDLMKLTIEKCRTSRSEILKRVRFALSYPSQDLLRNAVTHYRSWHRIVHEGLTENKRPAAPRKRASLSTRDSVIFRAIKEVERAFAHQATLTRAQVKDLEQLGRTIQKILDQIDKNDVAKMDKAS